MFTHNVLLHAVWQCSMNKKRDSIRVKDDCIHLDRVTPAGLINTLDEGLKFLI